MKEGRWTRVLDIAKPTPVPLGTDHRFEHHLVWYYNEAQVTFPLVVTSGGVYLVVHVLPCADQPRPKDRDEVNRREVCECDGWVCDLDGMGDPSKLSVIRKADSLTRASPTLFLNWGTQVPSPATKARGQLLAQERDIERLWAEGHTDNCQLRSDLDCGFRNELEKMKDNELANITHQLRELESDKNRKPTASILTILQVSEREIQKQFE